MERILIIGKDKEAQCVLCENLHSMFLIDIAESFEAAFNMIHDKKYSVVIASTEPVSAKGMEIIHKLKEVESDTPIIMITAHNTSSLAVEAMKAGALGYVTKPFNVDELRIVISHASEWHKLIREVREKKVFQELAITDGLTGVYNRRYFEELLDREIARATRYPQKFSVILMDIDDFKKFNDTYGHPAGDDILKDFAAFILESSRNTDFISRYGGEEFVIIAPHTEKEKASFFATRLLILASNREFGHAQKVRLGVSIGVASFGDDANTKELLLKCADDALYRAKKLGKNRVCIFGK